MAMRSWVQNSRAPGLSDMILGRWTELISYSAETIGKPALSIRFCLKSPQAEAPDAGARGWARSDAFRIEGAEAEARCGCQLEDRRASRPRCLRCRASAHPSIS